MRPMRPMRPMKAMKAMKAMRTMKAMRAMRPMRPMNAKGQTSFEMLVSLAALLAFSVPVVLLVLSSSQLRLEDLSVFHGRTSVQQLSDAINEVYLEGAGSQRTLLVELPSNTQNLTFSGNTVTLYLSTQNGVYQISHPVFAAVKPSFISRTGLANIRMAVDQNRQVSVSVVQ